MKKRILSFIFAVVLIFGSICTPFLASAADEDSTDYLLEEMKTNMPDFEPAKYVASSKGSPMIIGATLYESYHAQLGLWQETVFSLYVFNPRQLDITSALVNFFVSCWSDSDAFDPDFGADELRFYRDDYTRDRLFYKLTFNLTSALQNTRYTPGKHSLLAYVNSTEFSYQSENSTKTWMLDQGFQITFEPMAEGGFNVKTKSTALEQLDVKLTSYKIGTVDNDLTRKYEIFTAYFAIPEDYIKYYENLYSVTANFVRKHTTPIFWGNNPSLYPDYFLTDKANFISQSFDVSFPDICVFANTLINIDAGKYLQTNNHAEGPFYWWFYNPEGADGEVSREQIEAYIDAYKNVYNVTLFDSSEKVNMTHTIDESFDTSSYFESADYKNFWRDFGLEYALLYWAYNNPEIFSYGLGLGVFGDMLGWGERIAEFVESQKGIPSEYKDYLDDEPHLVFFNSEERAEALSLKDEELSRKYLIDLDDVGEFREYLTSNPYTVLFRYDIGESYSDSLYKVEKIEPVITTDYNKVKESVITDGYSYGIMTTNMYFDFNVIDVTFKIEDEYISVATRSSKKNFIPSISVTPMPDVPPLDNVFGDIFDGYKNLFNNGSAKNDVSTFLNGLGEKLGNSIADLTEVIGNAIKGVFDGFGDGMLGSAWGIVKPVLIVIGVALVIFVLLWVIRSVTGKNFFDVLFAGKNVRLKAEELAIRSSDSESRRREADQNAKLRERELDLKATEQANRKAEADADAKLRERDLARREREAEADAKLRGRDLDRREREAEADAKLRGRDLDRREREAEADAKLRGRDLDRREREAFDNKEARRIDQEIKAQELITRSEKDDRDFAFRKSADERSERYLKLREKAEKRTARDDRRKQKELREKDKAEKQKKLDETNPISKYTNFRVNDAMKAALDRTYKDDTSDKK